MSFKNKKNNQHLKCKECGEVVEHVGADAVAVTCWKCVHQGLMNCRADAPAQEKEEEK
jgi:hypothetical protein